METNRSISLIDDLSRGLWVDLDIAALFLFFVFSFIYDNFYYWYLGRAV
jgi:hypothetical protein